MKTKSKSYITSAKTMFAALQILKKCTLRRLTTCAQDTLLKRKVTGPSHPFIS